MEKQPKCIKCGRVLKAPISIARGMGPKCAGVTSASRKSIHTRGKLSSGMAYQSVEGSSAQIPLFTGELIKKKPLSKREIYRRQRVKRRRSFEMRKAFRCGLILPKRKPLIYQPLKDGNWREKPGGRIISHERLQKYLMRYRFI